MKEHNNRDNAKKHEDVARKKKKYLNKARLINDLIDAKKKDIEYLRSISGNPNIIKYQRSESKNTNAIKGRDYDIIATIDEYEKEIYKNVNKLIKAKQEIQNIIDEVEDYKERLFLQLYYINCYELEHIEFKMKYSRESLYKLHASALMNVKL